MTFDPSLIDALEELDPIKWDGEVYRYTSGGRPPDRENTLGARWNPVEVPTIYAALDQPTLVAEFNHALSQWSPAPDPTKFTAFTLRVQVAGIVDLRADERRAVVGLGLDDIASDDFTKCQRVGGAAHWLGRGGLLVPSARHPGGCNLVIFTDRQPADYAFEELSRSAMS